MTYEEWESSVSEKIKREPIWSFFGYRKALFLYELVWRDCQGMIHDPRGKAISQQIIRSAGSISANIEEGHGRGYGKQRNWFLSVAIGSARETKGWYWRARHLFPEELIESRMALLDEIISLLVTELSRQRGH
jgi:four helix bundle protein